MKIIKVLPLFAGILLFSAIFIKCKKDDVNTDKNIAYITGFYGVNAPRSFTFQNPDDSKFSRKVTMQWNDSGKVSITNVLIPRDSANENRQIAYLPSSELDTANQRFSPTNTVVKTVFYDVTSQEYLNCTSGYYYCNGCGPLTYGTYQLGTGYYYGMHCGSSAPNSICGPFWRCTGGSSCGKCQVIAFQTL